jgi:hypothetical protein
LPAVTGAPPRATAAAQLTLLGLLILAVPFGVRVPNAGRPEPPRADSPLPALGEPREAVFHGSRIPQLQRLNPGWIVIGDSMAGTRIDERRLGELAGRPVAPLLQAGSGSAFWYLALKNWVIASGIRPRAVFIFFRDTNLTQLMFRLDEQFHWSIGLVAGEREEELNARISAWTSGPWYRVHHAVERVYQGDRAQRWMEPALTTWPAEVMIPSRRRRTAFLQETNARFGLDHLRPMEAADIQTAEDREADFDRDVHRSALPLMLRDAKRAGLTLCLVRVQRRPIGGRPPAQSRAMRRYIDHLRDYIEANGGILHDDTGDPALTLDMYADGDHIARDARRRYTEILFERLRALFVSAERAPRPESRAPGAE